jgi:AcrR family transcriptional regulator
MLRTRKFSNLKIQEKKHKKDLISEVAAQIFLTKPFNQVTMRSIADAVGVTPAAIYSYFPDKNDLFAEAYMVIGDLFIKEISDQILNCEEFCIEDVALKYIHSFFGSENGRPFNFILQFMLDESIDKKSWEKINSTNRRFTAMIENFFRRFNQNSKLDIKIIAQSFIASLNGILLTSKNYPSKSEIEIQEHMKKHAVVIAEMLREKMSIDFPTLGSSV